MSFAVELIADTGLELGAGISWATGDLVQSGVTSDRIITYSGEDAKKRVSKIEILESVSEIFRSKETSGRASLGYGVFSGSASFRGSTAFKNSSYELSIAIWVDVALARFGLEKPKLNTQALEIESADDFYKTYGDYFILNYQRGAALLIVVSISVKSQEEKQSFAGELSASGALGSFSGSASGSVASRLQSMLQSKNYRISFEQFGGPDIDIDITSIQKAFESVNAFANAVTQNNAFNRSIEVVGYEYAAGIDGVFATEIRKLRLEQQFALDDLGSLIGKWDRILGDIIYVVRNAPLFDAPDVARLSTLKETYEDAIKSARRQADFLRVDHTHSVQLPTVPPVSFPAAKGPPTLAPSPPVPSAALVAPKVYAYTGPSCTGQRFELGIETLNFAPELNDKMRSFEIVGDFQINEWWISFYIDADRRGLFQTFNAPVRVNVLRGSYEVFDIWEGRTLNLPIWNALSLTSSVYIRKSDGRDVRPQWYRLIDDPNNPFPPF